MELECQSKGRNPETVGPPRTIDEHTDSDAVSDLATHRGALDIVLGNVAERRAELGGPVYALYMVHTVQ